MSKSKSSSYQSLSPTPSTSPSIAPGQSSGNNRTLTTAEVIKLLRQSGPSEVADYLERRQRLSPPRHR